MRIGFLSLALLFGLSLVLSACGNPEEKEAKYIRRGNELFDSGDYEKARIEYKNAARLKPTDAEVRYRLGLVEEAEGNLGPAFADFTHAAEQDAHYYPALAKIAEYYIAAEQYDEARKRLENIIAQTPDFADAYALLAALDLREKNYDAVESEARAALGKDHANVIAYSVLAGLYNTEGDKDKALAAIDEGLTHNPHELSLLLLKASFYNRAGEVDKAAETYQTIFKLRPAEKRYRVALAAIYAKANRLDDAEATLRAGVDAMPDDWSMKRQLIIFLGDKRGVADAEKQIRAYMQAYPHNDQLIFWLADLYVTHKQTDQAVALLQQVAAQSDSDKPSLTARALLARISLGEGNKDEAQKLTQEVLDKDATNPHALLVHAELAFGNGQYDDVVSDLRTIIRDNPQTRDAYPLLAEALVRQGRLDLAADTLKQLTDLDPLDFAARVRLAEITADNGNPKQALEQLTTLTKSNPAYAPAWDSAARISIQAKDWLTARAAIDALNGLEGQQDEATLLRGDMYASNDKDGDALAQYKQVASADPSSAPGTRALLALVVEYKKLNRLDDAIQFMEGLKTATPLVDTLLGECYLDLGKIESATAALDKAIAADAPLPDAYIMRAKLYLQAKNPDAAIAMLKKAAAVAPADIRAPLMEAEIDGLRGDYQNAIALYDDLLTRNPGLDAVANNLAEIIADYEYNDPVALAKARKTAERFAGSTNPLLLDTLAWVYYRQNDLGQAETIMERAITPNAKVPPQVHYHYGMILYKSGKRTAARAQLQQAIVENADYPGLDEAKKVLNETAAAP